LANEPVWLTADHLIEFNEVEVAATGEPHVVRDMSGLESAIGRPINHWHYGETDVVALAVALLLGVARNHPFLQGNKRTAFAAADYFLYLNGYELDPGQDSEALADFLIDAINGDVSEHYLIEVLGEWVTPA
jgi:death-on-curing protein